MRTPIITNKPPITINKNDGEDGKIQEILMTIGGRLMDIGVIVSEILHFFAKIFVYMKKKL